MIGLERPRLPLGEYYQLLLKHGLLADPTPLSADLTRRVEAVTCDSRSAVPGCLFICKGAAFKEEYLAEAIRRGAVAYVSEKVYDQPAPCLQVTNIRMAMGVLADHAWGHPSGRLTVIGITGTKGKTTAAWFLKAILDHWRQRQGKPPVGLLSTILIDDDSSVTVADILAKCRRVEDLGLIIIDYLQLMQSAGGKSGNRGENRQQIVSDISRSLKIMAKDLNVPVLCLSQLSRANESRQDKRPMLSDLRESGAIEQDADIVLFLYREGYYNADTENPNLAECIIAKNRHGETGKVDLQWTPEFTTFTDMEWRREEY